MTIIAKLYKLLFSGRMLYLFQLAARSHLNDRMIECCISIDIALIFPRIRP